jgi:glycosyltransferase involved in cell wall biosynthesis
MELAGGIQRRGLHVEVLTPRYASSWPETISVREVTVHRAVAAPRSDWSMGKYVRGLTAWLNQHAESFDVLIADSIREEALAAVEVARARNIRTIVACQGWSKFSDVDWWETSRAARRCAAAGRRADVTIAHAACCERALVVQGFDPAKIERIHPGFPVLPTPTPQRRQDARRALAAANADLRVEADTPVLLCNARMTRDGGINLLVRAAHSLLLRYPNLRLWFTGDGPYRDWIYQHLRSEGIRASIAMPGSFSDSVDLFLAANLYLQTDEDGLDYFLPAAISTELPVVAVDDASIRAVIDEGGFGSMIRNDSTPEPELLTNPPAVRASDSITWCETATPKGIRVGVSKVLDALPSARRRAEQLRRLLLRSRPQSQTTEAYVRLIQRLSPASDNFSIRAGTEAIS